VINHVRVAAVMYCVHEVKTLYPFFTGAGVRASDGGGGSWLAWRDGQSCNRCDGL